jgi:hypothetical protein
MLPRKAHYDPSADPAASIAKAEAEINSYGAKTGFKKQSDSSESTRVGWWLYRIVPSMSAPGRV